MTMLRTPSRKNGGNLRFASSALKARRQSIREGRRPIDEDTQGNEKESVPNERFIEGGLPFSRPWCTWIDFCHTPPSLSPTLLPPFLNSTIFDEQTPAVVDDQDEAQSVVGAASAAFGAFRGRGLLLESELGPQERSDFGLGALEWHAAACVTGYRSTQLAVPVADPPPHDDDDDD